MDNPYGGVAMINFSELTEVINKYLLQILSDPKLKKLHYEIIVAIKKAQSEFQHIHRDTPWRSFAKECLTPEVRARFDVLQKEFETRNKISLLGS